MCGQLIVGEMRAISKGAKPIGAIIHRVGRESATR